MLSFVYDIMYIILFCLDVIALSSVTLFKAFTSELL